MFFGKFLIDRGALNSSSLLDATVAQIESVPSFLRILIEDNVFEEGTVLNIIEKNIASGRSIYNIILEDNLMNKEELSKIIDRQFSKGKSLGQILIERGLVSYQDLEGLLQEFREVRKSIVKDDCRLQEEENVGSRIEESKEGKKSEVIENDGINEIEGKEKQSNNEEVKEYEAFNCAALESLKELGITSMTEVEEQYSAMPDPEVIQKRNFVTTRRIAALESLKELGIPIEGDDELKEEDAIVDIEFEGEKSLKNENMPGITVEDDLDEIFTEQLLNIFDDDKFQSMCVELKKLSRGPNSDILLSLHQNMKTIQGSAKLAKSNLLTKILIVWESVLNKIIDKKVDFVKINFLRIASGLKEGIRLGHDIRNHIEEFENESGILNNIEWKGKYLSNIKLALGLIKQ